jgi:transposase
MPFAALDLHRKMVEAVILDDQGAVLYRDRFPATREALEAFARRHLSTQHKVAVEATTNTWAVADLLRPYAQQVVISNPLRTRAIATAKIKTDRVDALVLAQLLRSDYLPGVWHPDQETQIARRRSTSRAVLVSDRTRVKNRIHAVLHQRLIPAPAGDLFSARNLDWLAAQPLDPDGRAALDCNLRLLAHIEGELEIFNRELAAHAYQSDTVKLLMTLPGVDVAVAETLMAALGDISRFPTADQAAAYLGLVPSTYQSGEHCYHGRITKQGRGHARWMLVQAAQHLGTHPGPIGVFFRRIAQRKTRNIAVVAAARKLVTVAWHMLKNNEPYRYAQPHTTEAKFSRLRINAGGAKKRGGLPKGSPRPANYGTGQGTRAVPALDAVYAGEQLPPRQELKPGEQKQVAQKGLTAWFADISRGKRVPRGADKKADH